MPADRLLHPRLGHSTKVSGLSHLEFRVWCCYQLTADDYGVMRMSAVTIQASDDALAREKPKAIEAALRALVACNLLQKFEHQGRTYVYQCDWQNFQRVKHPRDTMQPLPPADQCESCTPATRKLFEQHPRKNANESVNDIGNISEMLPKDSGSSSEVVSESLSENGSLACARTRETANGLRLTANGLEKGRGDPSPPMDQWARELVGLYPPAGRCGWNLVEQPLYSALTLDQSVDVTDAWAALKTRLDAAKRSHQWLVKRMIPRLDRWLRDGLHLQELPADVPSSKPAKPDPWANFKPTGTDGAR